MLPARMANSEIKIRLQREGAGQPLDDVFRTKMRTIEGQFEPEVTIYGQPRFFRNLDQQAGGMFSGDREWTSGAITISAAEVARLGFNPQRLKNARIVGFKRLHNAPDTVDRTEFVITEVRPRGHLTGGPILFKLFFNEYLDVKGAV